MEEELGKMDFDNVDYTELGLLTPFVSLETDDSGGTKYVSHVVPERVDFVYEFVKIAIRL